MMEKYFVYVPGVSRPMAVKYNYDTRQGAIGGYTSEISTMKALMTDYFGGAEWSIVKPKTNRVRLNFSVSHSAWDYAVRTIKEHGIELKPVRSHERIMR
jgi:hypothetical protein